MREIHRRVAACESCEVIAADFEARAIARRFSKQWSRERVWALATSTTYRGRWIADKRRKLAMAVPEIVTAEEWQATHNYS